MAVAVSGAVKDYAWGMVDGMVPWTGRGTGRPQAELWFGVHPSGPSPTLTGSTADVALADHRVPLMVKLLAAAHPLSIQLHPDADLAESGYARQAGGQGLYSDPAEKTEMIVAMSDFQALAGWRDTESAARVLGNLGYPRPILAAAAAAEWADAARMIMAGMPSTGPWDPSRVRRALESDDPGEAAALGDAAAVYPTDPGLGVAAILAYHRLSPGEAMFVPAGVPHAYLRGVALEVMTSSDNVLRLGLTHKDVAVAEALRALRLDRAPEVLTDPGPKHPSGAPFRVDLQRGVDQVLPTGRYRVVLAVDGPVDVAIGMEEVALEIGQGLLIPATDPGASVRSAAMVALVEATSSPT